MSARPNQWPLPPIALVATIAVCWLLSRVAPLGWEAETITPIMRFGGVLLIVIALALDVWTFSTLRRHATTVRPDRAATALATDGAFKLSRNPIYLGNVLIVAGIGFAAGSRWYVLGAAVLFFVLQEFAVKREEAHLAAKFGMAWDDFAARTRRWL